MRRFLHRCTAAPGAVAALAVVAAPPSPGAEMDLAARVSVAKTAADHGLIAAEYEKKAAEARAEAERHRGMMQAYRGELELPTPARPDPRPRGMDRAAEPCEGLTRTFRQMAAKYSELADLHRRKASEVEVAAQRTRE